MDFINHRNENRDVYMNEEIHAEMKEGKKISETKDLEVTETTKNKPAGRLGKKQLGLIGAAVIIVIALLIGIGIGNSPTGRLVRQLELGQKYLEEMNYEEAVVVFNNVIEIDPVNADAYLGLVEVYIRTGDFDTALAYAEKGYEVTGDERLKEKIDMIERGNITASNGWTMKTSHYDFGELMWYETYTYDLQGRTKSTTLYNGANQLVDEGEWQYDDQGNMVVWYYGWQKYVGDAVSAELIKNEAEYDSGTIICYT